MKNILIILLSIISLSGYSQTSSATKSTGIPGTDKVIKILIGYPAAISVNFKFTSVANTTAQNMDLGTIIPARCRVRYIEIVTTQATSSGTMAFVVGNASAGAQFIASIAVAPLNTVAGIIDMTKPSAVVMNWTTATHVWINATPSVNWSTLTAGLWTVYIVYTDYTQK